MFHCQDSSFPALYEKRRHKRSSVSPYRFTFGLSVRPII
jgi:hypothetical protein